MNANYRFALGLIVGMVLIGIWFAFFVEMDAMSYYLKRINLLLAASACLFYFSAYLFRIWRWWLILQSVQRISYLETASLFFSGMFINYLLPIRAGEVAKSVFLKRLKETPISKSLPTILLNKAFDLVPILLVWGMLPFVAVHVRPELLILCGILVIILWAAVAILVLSVKNEKFVIDVLKKIFFWLPPRFKDNIFDFIDRFVVAVGLMTQTPLKWLLLVVLTFCAVILEALFFKILFLAFGYNLAFSLALFGYTLVTLSYILPSPPAQIGSAELVILFIFSVSLGLDENLVGAVTAFAHVITGFLVALWGVIALSSIGIQLTELIRPIKEETITG
ncbi:MAG: TIGR00374 family protein [Gemmatimonadetes bacterium]|nr:MAG: TIGR00374 family protein [Gemmatimonadota bacterium]